MRGRARRVPNSFCSPVTRVFGLPCRVKLTISRLKCVVRVRLASHRVRRIPFCFGVCMGLESFFFLVSLSMLSAGIA